MNKKKIINLLRTDVRAFNKWREENPKAIIDVSNSDLSSMDLSWANFYMANLSGANLSSSDLFKSNFSYADLSRSNLSDADSQWANFYMANFSYVKMHNANFSDSYFRGVNFSCACINGSNFSDANLRKANFSESSACGVNFSSSNLRDANFYLTDLRKSNFKGSNFYDVRLIGAKYDFIFLKNKYDIFIHVDWMQIGYESYSIHDWYSFSDDDIINEMGDGMFDWWKENKTKIFNIIERKGLYVVRQ